LLTFTLQQQLILPREHYCEACLSDPVIRKRQLFCSEQFTEGGAIKAITFSLMPHSPPQLLFTSYFFALILHFSIFSPSSSSFICPLDSSSPFTLFIYCLHLPVCLLHFLRILLLLLHFLLISLFSFFVFLTLFTLLLPPYPTILPFHHFISTDLPPTFNAFPLLPSCFFFSLASYFSSSLFLLPLSFNLPISLSLFKCSSAPSYP
jgi:hypothetical protein